MRTMTKHEQSELAGLIKSMSENGAVITISVRMPRQKSRKKDYTAITEDISRLLNEGLGGRELLGELRDLGHKFSNAKIYEIVKQLRREGLCGE